MDYTNSVENAVKKFYSTGSTEAHIWLLQFQTSREAWRYVWPLMEPCKPWEVQFFAATTLHAKISKHWDELPASDYTDLKDRLLNLMKASTTSKLILSRLCQALASFLVNCDSFDEKNKNEGILDDLVNILPYNSPQNLNLLLRTLTAVPTEYEKRMGIKKNRMREGLVASWCKTAWVLDHVFTSCSSRNCLESNDETMYLLGLECGLVWLKLDGIPLDSIAQIFQHFLAAADKYAPTKDESPGENRPWEIIQDCLITSMGHQDLQKRPQLFWEWSKNLVSIADRKNGMMFSEILTSLGDGHSRTFLLALTNETDESRKWTAETLVKLLLECAEHPGRYPIDEQRSCIPFGFWYTLQDDLITLDSPEDEQAKNALRPIYIRLAHALLRKTTLPSSPEEAGDPDEQELLRCYRQDAADTMTYCYNVLGEELLLLLGQRLSYPEVGTQKWTDIESTLHAFQSLSDSVGTNLTEYVPALLDLVLSYIPYNNFPKDVMASACVTIGAYAEWIGEHPDPWLERSLQLITLALTQGNITATPASMALKDISRECGSHLAPLAPSILNTISRTLPIVSPGGSEGLRLMYAAGRLLNSLSSIEEQIKHLDATLGICVVRIQELLQQPSQNIRIPIANQLKMVTMFLSTLEGAIGKSVLDGLLPIFTHIINHAEWNQDDMILEAMHTCAQRSLQCLLHPEIDAKPLLPLLVMSYKIHPHPAALTLLRNVVLLFSRDPENVIGPIFADIVMHSLRGFTACNSFGGNLSDVADLLEAFLGLLAQICKKTPQLMLQVPELIPEMLKCGISGLGLPESGVIKAAGTFLAHAIIQSSYFLPYIEIIGQDLVNMTVLCIGGRISRSDLEAHAKVLVALNNNCGNFMSQWLRSALQRIDVQITTPGQKEDFAKTVLRERMNNRRLYEILQKFSIQCHKPVMGL